MQNETNLSVWPAYSGLRILITSKQRRANICKRLKKKLLIKKGKKVFAVR